MVKLGNDTELTVTSALADEILHTLILDTLHILTYTTKYAIMKGVDGHHSKSWAYKGPLVNKVTGTNHKRQVVIFGHVAQISAAHQCHAYLQRGNDSCNSCLWWRLSTLQML